METNVLPALKASQTKLNKVIADINGEIDTLESKPLLTSAEEEKRDRLCYKADTLNEAADYIEDAIKLLTNYK